MRHHFTKSERLALKVMAALHMDFTDMESGKIRKETWLLLSHANQNVTSVRTRRVLRVVSFTIKDRRFPLDVGVKVSLEGWETEIRSDQTAPSQETLKSETIWRVSKIMMGCHSERRKKGVQWHKLHIPDDSDRPIHMQFPHYLMRGAEPVVSADA